MRSAVLLSVLGLATSVRAADSLADAGPSWLGHLVTFLGIIVAAAMIIYQLGQQHKNETARLNENFKGQLKLQIYQDFSQRLTTASDAAGAAGFYATTSHTHSVIFTKQVAQGLNPQPIVDRALQLLDKNSLAANEATEVVFLVEKYYIVHPDLDIFRTAICSAVHDLHAAFHVLFDFMLSHFPVDAHEPSGATIGNVKALAEAELATLHQLTSAYQDAAMDLDCYLMDMRVELQTLLLGHLFANTVPRRRPSDPSKRVITLDPAGIKSLRQHFLKNTDWGKRAVASQLEVHRDFHGRTH